MTNDDEKTNFYAGMINELFASSHGALERLPHDINRALDSAFEETYRRLDFENFRVAASFSHPPVEQAGMNFTLVAIRFGNFLAQKGILLNDDPPIEQ